MHFGCAYAQRAGELATDRRRDEVGRAPADRVEPGVARLRKLRDRLQQCLRVRVARLGEQRPGRRVLDDLARVHHCGVVGPTGDDAEVVGHQNHGHEALALLRLQEVEDLRLHGHVERGGGLVGEEQSGTARQRDRNHDPLAHPAGELVRILAQPAFRLGNAYRLEERERRLVGVVLGDIEVVAERLGDLVADAHYRVERCHRVLEHHRHLGAPIVAHRLRVGVADLAAFELDAAVAHHVAGQQSHDRARQHRLARTRLTDDADGLAPLQRERDAIDRAHKSALGLEERLYFGDVEQRTIERCVGEPVVCLANATAPAHRTLSRTSKRARTTSPR